MKKYERHLANRNLSAIFAQHMGFEYSVARALGVDIREKRKNDETQRIFREGLPDKLCRKHGAHNSEMYEQNGAYQDAKGNIYGELSDFGGLLDEE